MSVDHPVSQKQAEALIAKFERSEMSRKEFCKKHDIKIGTFHWWLKRHKDNRRKSPQCSPFVQIRPTTDATLQDDSGTELILDFKSGTRLQWRGKELPGSLFQLISAVELRETL